MDEQALKEALLKLIQEKAVVLEEPGVVPADSRLLLPFLPNEEAKHQGHQRNH